MYKTEEEEEEEVKEEEKEDKEEKRRRAGAAHQPCLPRKACIFGQDTQHRVTQQGRAVDRVRESAGAELDLSGRRRSPGAEKGHWRSWRKK
ncbi:hypothetical protein O3P69_009890 [Scylla paramamosain]|uniref:Uncharacterized protein n=1 Tax=Scylla paramamosain TaxID=85552 RepID=A0AAW0SNA3_SCYPA